MGQKKGCPPYVFKHRYKAELKALAEYLCSKDDLEPEIKARIREVWLNAKNTKVSKEKMGILGSS